MNILLYHQLHRSSASVAERISLAEAKLFLRVDTPEDDILISELIIAARIYAEHYLGCSLVEQEWTAEYRDITSSEIILPMSPVASITSITIENSNHQPVIISADMYRLVAPDRVLFLSPLSSCAAKIIYRSDDNEFDEMSLKVAMLHHIALCYEMRHSSAPLPAQSQHIYNSYKAWRV